MRFRRDKDFRDDASWPQPREEFVRQLADDIDEHRRPEVVDGSRRFRLSFAIVGAIALFLPLAAFADQAGDNLARRDESTEVELVATDDDDDGGGGDDSETSVAGAYDVGGDSDSESSGHVGAYDDGGGEDSEDSESDDGGQQQPQPPAAPGGDEDSDSDDGGPQAQLPPLQPQQTPAPPPSGGGDDTEDSDT